MYGTFSILKIRQVLIASNWGQITYMKLVEVTPVLKQKSMVSLTLEVVQLKSSLITDPISQHDYLQMNQFSDADLTVCHQFLSNLPGEENISFRIFLGDQC